jgi:hypothetical protein
MVVYFMTPESIGFHPFYETIFHQIVNGYSFFNYTLPSDYTSKKVDGTIKQYERNPIDNKSWTSFIDNSKINTTDTKYTLLPSNGYNDINGSDFTKAEQENFRILWNIATDDKTTVINYSGYTFPSYGEYFKDTSGEYSLSGNYRKVIDLIAIFKPDILDVFEEAFIDFASEKLNEEITYSPYDVKYSKFQDLLKEIVSISQEVNDPIDANKLIETIKSRQLENLQVLTNEIVSDNLIRISLANPREIDNYVLGGFTGTNVKNFTIHAYNSGQYSIDNQNKIKLYLGEDLDLYYKDFFSVNDVELNEDNIIQFRPLIYMYAGLRAKGETKTKLEFIEYLKSNIISASKNTTTGVSGQDVRLNLFLTQLIEAKIPKLEIKASNQIATIQRGYNDDPMKLELYNYFKSFNDKWTSGNSIGQRTLMEEFLFLDKANRDIGDVVFIDMQKLTKLSEPGNEEINLFSLISLLVQDTGFDIRALPAYVNFYGTNFSNAVKTTPSKTVARNMFGTFLDIDYQDASPKIILQYVGPTSKHPELSDINKKYKYKNDGFDISNIHNNPIIVAPDVFTKTDFSKSNKVVAFEVSFGDQNQSIFKGVELDQSTIKNTSESFQVLERLGRNETGSSTSQIDIGLFDIYRQSSYQCQVTAMGNMMIQPTMYFYLKNVPLFRGSYLITEVTHNIKTTGIETMFKGTRIPSESLPNPTDSFLASYRPLFDTLVNRAHKKVQESLSGTTSTSGTSGSSGIIGATTEKTSINAKGSYTYDMGNISIPSEKIVNRNSITPYGIPYNGYKDEKYIQLVRYNNTEWLRAYAVQINGAYYKVENDISMSIISRMCKDIKFGDIPRDGVYYFSRFDLGKADPTTILYGFPTTEFLNPNILGKEKPKLRITTTIDCNTKSFTGPISVGPSILKYGVALTPYLMKALGLYDGQIVYFRLLS